MRFDIKSSSLKHNKGNNMAGAAFYGSIKLVFFCTCIEHHLKLWIIIKENKWANFVINKGLKILNRERWTKFINEEKYKWTSCYKLTKFYPYNQIWCTEESMNYCLFRVQFYLLFSAFVFSFLDRIEKNEVEAMRIQWCIVVYGGSWRDPFSQRILLGNPINKISWNPNPINKISWNPIPINKISWIFPPPPFPVAF